MISSLTPKDYELAQEDVRFAKMVKDEQGNLVPQPIWDEKTGKQKVKKYKDGSIIPLHEVDETKVQDLAVSQIPRPTVYETKQNRSKTPTTIVNNNSGSESGGSWSKGKNANLIPLIVKPVTEGSEEGITEGGIGGFKQMMEQGLNPQKNMSIAQINSAIGEKTTLGNNTIVINPNTSGAKSNIKLISQKFGKNGVLEPISAAEQKELEGKEAKFGTTSQIEYFPVNVSGRIVQNQAGDEGFGILKNDRVVVGAAPFIKAKVGDKIYYIPASSLDAEIPQWLDRPWLEKKGYGIDVSTTKEVPSDFK
jgi:hypothetical protein